MLRQIRASRLKTFALVTAACAVALPLATTMLWTRWGIDAMARGLGLPQRPVVVGLVLALLPMYFAAVEIWLPLRQLPPREAPRPRAPLTETQLHWNAVRVVALVCILLVELVAQSVPDHRAAHAAAIGIR
jgi:membrane-associated phospholipid phosphatase